MMAYAGTRGVRRKKADNSTRRGLRIIVDFMQVELEEDLRRILVDPDEQDLYDVRDALEWMNQYASQDDVYG